MAFQFDATAIFSYGSTATSTVLDVNIPGTRCTFGSSLISKTCKLCSSNIIHWKYWWRSMTCIFAIKIFITSKSFSFGICYFAKFDIWEGLANQLANFVCVFENKYKIISLRISGPQPRLGIKHLRL